MAKSAIQSAMLLKEWRLTQQKTMRECADLIGLGDARSYQRYEIGAQWPAAPTVEKISDVSGGLVTVADLHQQRLMWLRENRPEVFDGDCESVSREAAE